MLRHLVSQWRESVFMVVCQDINSKGTCFAISPDGYFVTNNHVVAELTFAQGALQVNYSAQPVISVNGTHYPAQIVSSTTDNRPIVFDYALLKVDGIPNLAALDLLAPTDDVVVSGDDVVCLGYPLDFEECVATQGVVSALTRRPSHWNSIHLMQTILTDTLIQFGNSGGPMIHAPSGRVIGVNTLKHELRDALIQRLKTWHQHPQITQIPGMADLILFTLKYTYVGLNHAVSIEHAMKDPAWPL